MSRVLYSESRASIMPQKALSPSSPHLVIIILIRKLDVDLMLCADLGDHGPLSSNNFRVVFGVNSDSQLEASQGL